MKFATFSFLLVVCFCLCARPASAVESLPTQLRALGEVVETNGVVTRLSIKDAGKFTAAEYKLIGSATTLTHLTILNCPTLNDTTLPLLAPLTKLEMFGPENMALTDDGMKLLLQFKKLRTFSPTHFGRSIWGKGFTGAGWAHLKDLPTLENIVLGGVSYTDDAMNAIVQLQQVRNIGFGHNKMTKAGYARLAELPNLEVLSLMNRLAFMADPPPTALDDSTFAWITKLRKLKNLSLMEARYTYGGLSQLRALPDLKVVNIRLALVDAADVERLKTEMPKVTWNVQQPTPEQRAAAEKIAR